MRPALKIFEGRDGGFVEVTVFQEDLAGSAELYMRPGRSGGVILSAEMVEQLYTFVQRNQPYGLLGVTS
ncbi:MAG: hypothetical protein AAGA99_00560 [Actinomycetota bacterium]